MMKKIMVGVCYACNCKVVKSGPFCPGTYISYSLLSIYTKVTTHFTVRLTHGSRTTVANTRFHKKGQAYQKSFQKMS